jgi:predicted enzyme related to lactoylglutathione lyase
MAVGLFRVIIPVEDIDAAAGFYAKLLGWTGERVAPNRHYFDCEGTILACVDPQGEHAAFRPNIEHIYFTVDNLEEQLDRARAAGCSWLDERMETRPWGERSFYARDPFGNPICFVERGTEFTGGRFVP